MSVQKNGEFSVLPTAIDSSTASSISGTVSVGYSLRIYVSTTSVLNFSYSLALYATAVCRSSSLSLLKIPWNGTGALCCNNLSPKGITLPRSLMLFLPLTLPSRFCKLRPILLKCLRIVPSVSSALFSFNGLDSKFAGTLY